MNSEDWPRINELFHRALAEPRERRAAFIDAACLDTPSLKGDVASLVAAHERASGFMEAPAGLDRPAGAPGVGPEPDAAEHARGQHIGQYRLQRVIGRGGMGVVYLAEDTRLGRIVALKAVSPRYTNDNQRRERLRREARAAAALSHPGIATVYALEEFGEQLYLACEYVPGATLREEIARGPLPPARALETALQLARALAAAHDRGIIHRDLKPENVVRRPSGDVKILDFGLARLRDPSGELPTLTEDGMVLGTPAYMSPEQARGRAVDFRSDLFSLGIVLHELASGVHPFAGLSTASTIVNILEADAPRLRGGRGPGDGSDWVERITDVCLQKDRERRYPSTHELVGALAEACDAVAAGRPAGAPGPWGAAVEDAAGDPRAQWWWQFHQAAVALAYGLLLWPVWYARKWTGGVAGPLLFLGALVAATVAGTLRLHLWFTLRSYPSEWRTQRRRSVLWITLADVSYVGVLLASAGYVLSSHGDIAVLLVGIAVAVLLSAAIIEPATTRAAFPARGPGAA